MYNLSRRTQDNGELNRAVDPYKEYKMDNIKRGRVLIFNQETFDNQYLHKRLGTNKDRDNLIERFEEMQFDVSRFNDGEKKEVMDELRKAANENHTNSDCFVCIFLSHGSKGKICVKDGRIKIEAVTGLFRGDKCRSLAGKPKIFIFQASRGKTKDDADVAQIYPNPPEVQVDIGGLYTLPSGADFLMCYSVAEGYFSHRHEIDGSWYIQDLCDILKCHGQDMEFTDLLALVSRKVSKRSLKTQDGHVEKQMPCYVSMLTKKLYFRPK